MPGFDGIELPQTLIEPFKIIREPSVPPIAIPEKPIEKPFEKSVAAIKEWMTTARENIAQQRARMQDAWDAMPWLEKTGHLTAAGWTVTAAASAISGNPELANLAIQVGVGAEFVTLSLMSLYMKYHPTSSGEEAQESRGKQ